MSKEHLTSQLALNNIDSKRGFPSSTANSPQFPDGPPSHDSLQISSQEAFDQGQSFFTFRPLIDFSYKI